MKTTNNSASKEATKIEINSTSKVKESKYVAMGVGFVKTRMAAWKVQKIIDSMEDIAESLDVELVDVVVDRSGSRDIDRKEIDAVYEWLDVAPVHLLIVESLTDISDDEDDFRSFMRDMDERDIIIICLHGQQIIMPSSARDDSDCEE